MERLVPECITLGVRGDATPSDKPPVRIFLGTELSQYRPERVLVWSIEQVRDPSRVYEIHLMKELEGFDRHGWTTGFTNYRFAIPHYAGERGRAIYNDEDQIYLTDPARLFDLELDGAGFLAISPTESSVMLIDCERMASVWSLEDAQRLPKKTLLRRAVAIPGLCGGLAGEWNARDGEYCEGSSHLLHYTTLHTQPWRPFPERFVYQEQPLGHLWHDLERSADAAGFQLFSRARPSAAFAGLCAANREGHGRADPVSATELAELAKATGSRSVLDYQPLAAAAPDVHDGAVWRGSEAAPEDDVPWLLDELFASSRRFVWVEARGEPGRWPDHLAAASCARPGVHWRLSVRPARGAGAGGAPAEFRGGRFPGSGPPAVRVLADDDAGSSDPALALAAELGWPVRRWDKVGPPWPDLVIASGPRALERVRGLGRRTGPATRVVALGAEARAEDFDLVVSPLSADFFPHPRRLEVALPLVRIGTPRLSAAAEPWRKLFEESPAPRIALWVEGGGESGGAAPRPEAALREVREVIARVEGRAGSLFATLDSQLPTELAGALEATQRSAGVTVHVHRGEPARRDEAYLAQLALAEEFVVFSAGSGETALADACASGRPVSLLPEPAARSGPAAGLRRAVNLLARARRSNNRGTVRPQRGLEHFCSRLLAEGRARPPRNAARRNAFLHEARVATPHGEGEPQGGYRPLREVARAAERVRELLGAD